MFRDNDRLSEEDCLFFSVLQNCFAGNLNENNFRVLFNMAPDAPNSEDKRHYAETVNACHDQMNISKIPIVTENHILTVENFKKEARK